MATKTRKRKQSQSNILDEPIQQPPSMAVKPRERKQSNSRLNWGLIWRKKTCEDTGSDFGLKHILLRGNADTDLIKPLCRLCSQPYDADLMYIRCETCHQWFHADSVELDESQISFLVGFKCCKCRKIKSPVCPYLDLEKKKVLEDKIECQQAAKQEISGMDFDCDIISDHHKEVEPAYSALPRKAEVIHDAADNPLLASLAEVKQYTKGKSEVNHGCKAATASGPGPEKLSLRRVSGSKQGCETQAAVRVDSNLEFPTSSLIIQGQDSPNPTTATKCKESTASLAVPEHSSEVKPTSRSAVTKKNRKLNWGLIWRKKNCEDTNFDFRSKNILLRGNADRDLIEPRCRLCNQPYNADLMYIRCETCHNWFHADSMELDESKIFYLVGFKCCKCCKIKAPVCPYLNP